MTRTCRIVHLIPRDGVGGVETAAKSIGSLQDGALRFEVDYLFKSESASKFQNALDPVVMISQAVRRSREEVDILIVSLWRAYFVGAVFKLLRPRSKLVVFLHSSKHVHWLDVLCTRWAASLADEAWADCQATLTGRLTRPPLKVRIISFLTRRFDAPPPRAVEPTFIFWGRLAPGKGLERAVRIFASIREKRRSARFVIIGPDRGSEASLKTLVASLGLKDAVVFRGAATHDEIAGLARNASFYLQTSEQEGMAMSVVEAMQLGLAPIVTPVGEIGSYCREGYNSVIVDSDRDAVATVLELLDSDGRYQRLRANAVATWEGRRLYRDSVLDACRDLLDDHARSVKELC
ncbi:glycosyltransferase family 4 protein [Methylocystis heyeri]|uniref:Glycosyltransferase n=1 Tax=Methylocystis heyeri TaxID=391905 RepID=A0A6B8KAV4_9HYPH|nr:glycosyltransferase family 4 protein [Methylocystis heyeri]QGM45236.1 glycosyltransferase [Methylocystis heyeri]